MKTGSRGWKLTTRCCPTRRWHYPVQELAAKSSGDTLQAELKSQKDIQDSCFRRLPATGPSISCVHRRLSSGAGHRQGYGVPCEERRAGRTAHHKDHQSLQPWSNGCTVQPLQLFWGRNLFRVTTAGICFIYIYIYMLTPPPSPPHDPFLRSGSWEVGSLGCENIGRDQISPNS